MLQTLTKTHSPTPPQILIVEDEKIIALNLKENLESLGYQVVGIADSGEDAIEKATQRHPDLVLMDIRLQGSMDGIQAAQQIWETLSIPVIYVTGHSDQSTLERAKLTAPFGYILKPVKEKELYVAIETAMERYEREQLLTAILREMGDGVIVVDPQCRVKFLNRAAEALTGWHLSEAKEQELATIFQLVDEHTQQPTDNPVTVALQNDTTIYVKNSTLLLSKNGTAIPIADSAAPIKDKKGMNAGAVLVFQDITDSAQLEKAKLALEHTLTELRYTQAQLIQSEKMSSIGRMVAAIVNEIKSPVSLLVGNLPLVRSYFEDVVSLLRLYQQTYLDPTPKLQHITQEIDLEFIVDDWQKMMQSLQLATHRIFNIILSIQSLRNASKLDKLELTSIDIHDSIDAALQILQHRLQASDDCPEIRVIRDYGQLPPIIGDANQLNQVFVYLLNNAIDALDHQFSPRLITIRTEVGDGDVRDAKTRGQGSNFSAPYPTPHTLHPEQSSPSSPSSSPTPSIAIHITDNGCGMNEDVQRKMFDPFFTTKPAGSGSGLGLSISYQIVVTRHGGQMRCHSAPGWGTEFVIELPLDGGEGSK